MKYKILISSLLCAALLLSACGSSGNNAGTAQPESTGSAAVQSAADDSASAEPQKISAEQAYERMQSGEPIVILDVRTAEEYEAAHIPGAILIPNEEIGDSRPAQLPVLDTEILIYCRSGNRSAQAAAKLSELGYTKLFDFGGINDWPYETETGAWQQEENEGTFESFVAYDLNGIARDESVFSGYKLTMVNIWATFCGPCLREMPELGELAADYSEKGVQIVGLVADVSQNSDGSFVQSQVEDVRALVEETGANYIHLLPTSPLMTNQLKGVNSVPTTIFVNEKGQQVGQAYVGSRSGSDWAAIVDSILAEAE